MVANGPAKIRERSSTRKPASGPTGPGPAGHPGSSPGRVGGRPGPGSAIVGGDPRGRWQASAGGEVDEIGQLGGVHAGVASRRHVAVRPDQP